MHEFLLGVPRAAGIWVALILLPALVVAGLVAAGRRRRAPNQSGGGAAFRRAATPAERRTPLAPDAARELGRYAAEVAIAADRAAESARTARVDWLSTQDELERLWSRVEAADAEARRVARTVGLPTPRTPRTPTEYADRERYLHRVAMAACAHSELSAVDLSRILAHRDGWDPRRHPVEQEVRLRRAIADGLRTAHGAAVARERAAWSALEAAAADSARLRAEARVATERVTILRPRAVAVEATPVRVRYRVGVARPGYAGGMPHR